MLIAVGLCTRKRHMFKVKIGGKGETVNSKGYQSCSTLIVPVIEFLTGCNTCALQPHCDLHLLIRSPRRGDTRERVVIDNLHPRARLVPKLAAGAVPKLCPVMSTVVPPPAGPLRGNTEMKNGYVGTL